MNNEDNEVGEKETYGINMLQDFLLNTENNTYKLQNQFLIIRTYTHNQIQSYYIQTINTPFDKTNKIEN